MVLFIDLQKKNKNKMNIKIENKTIFKAVFILLLTYFVAYSVNSFAKTDALAVKDQAYDKTSGTQWVSVDTSKTVWKQASANVLNYTGDEVSSKGSFVSPKYQTSEVSNGEALLTVNLLDGSNKPIAGHKVKLISSSPSVSMKFLNNSDISDFNGNVKFLVSSPVEGAVTFTAYDETNKSVIENRAKVAYLADQNFVSYNDEGFDYEYAATGSSSGALDHFNFVSIPSTIYSGEYTGFAVQASDAGEQAVLSYTGKVHFSVKAGEPAVTLPADYQYVTQDMGLHTFSLAFMFQTSGSYTLQVCSVESPTICGEQVFEVSDKTVGPGEQSTITLTSPVSGTSSNNVQVVSGTTTPGASLKIFDNDIEIGSATADINGVFSFTTSQLMDGAHKIYVAEVNEGGTIVASSDLVEVAIDTSGPAITNVVFDPSGEIGAGTQAVVKLYTVEKLAQAAMIIDSNIYELVEDPSGFYYATFTVPNNPGPYNVSFDIVDNTGNETRIDNMAVLTVKMHNAGDPTGSGTQLPPPVVLVGDVIGLTASVNNGRVILNWSAPQSSYLIKNYRVFYGFSPNEMVNAIDTFTNATTWYIPNLSNGVQYYLAVTAIDEKDNISEHLSNIVIATPNPVVTVVQDPCVLTGTCGADNLEDMDEDAGKAGPEFLWIIVISALGGIFYVQTSKKRMLS